tara:strand:+ start:156 stop:272 length:117 start_codon:yes stop_codon:yes gene_type:complete
MFGQKPMEVKKDVIRLPQRQSPQQAAASPSTTFALGAA